MTETKWQEQALCAELSDKDIFYELDNAESIKKAKTVCGACPVRKECLTDSRQRLDVWAIAGGYTPAQRGIKSTDSQYRASLPYSDRKKPGEIYQDAIVPKHGTHKGFLRHTTLKEKPCDFCATSEMLLTLHSSFKKWDTSGEDYK